MDALNHAQWFSYAPRVAGFLEDSLKDIWTTKPEADRDHMVSRILDAGERLGFRKLASVFKFAGLVAGSDGAFLQDENVMRYLAEGENPDLQLERLITSMRVMEALNSQAPNRSGS